MGTYEKSIKLRDEYLELAKELNLKIVDVQDKMILGVDGAHITEESHMMLAKAIVV